MKRNISTLFSMAVLLAVCAPRPAMAQQPESTLSRTQAGYYFFKIGDVEVTALSDGTLTLATTQLLTNAKPGEITERLAAMYQGLVPATSITAYLMQVGDRVVLVDAGTGPIFGPTLNKLGASLKSAGVSPDKVTDILITHMHADHVGGLSEGNRRLFPNAVVQLDKKELDHWMSAENRANAAPAGRPSFDNAAKAIKPYLDAGKVKTFNGATTLAPGISSVPTHGHTPGHTSYLLESKGEKVIFLGDLVHVPEVQLPSPHVTIQFDSDPQAAAASRKKVFTDAAAGGYWIAGTHISFPGLGHLRVEGDGFRWIPATFVNDHYK